MDGFREHRSSLTDQVLGTGNKSSGLPDTAKTGYAIKSIKQTVRRIFTLLASTDWNFGAEDPGSRWKNRHGAPLISFLSLEIMRKYQGFLRALFELNEHGEQCLMHDD
jgi:hypothetical protein